MRTLKIILPIVALVAAIGFFYTQFFSASTDPDTNTARNSAVDQSISSSSSTSVDSTVSSSLSIDDTAVDTSLEPIAQSDESVTDESIADKSQASENSNLPTVPNTAQASADYPETYGYEIATGAISDEEFLALVARLKNDPFLRNELMNELRAETDPERIKQLTALLGETGSADILVVAEELVYSSVPETQKAGTELLSRLAPSNAEAYDIAVSILSSSADPEVLVSTMNILAVPKNAGAEIKSEAVTQIMPLSEHESAAVRRQSVSLLSRLSNDVAISPILYGALNDSSSNVRSTATYALARHPHQSPEAVERLLQIAESAEETDGVRRGAIYALQQWTPSQETQARISQAKRQMRDAALAAQ